MPDQYTRTRAQLGTPALDALRKAHVAVFGIGGVGGQAVEVLARSGVGELSLFDSDIVALSNLNRQLVALHSTLGQYKVDAMAARIADIDPTIVVHANRMFYNAETAADVDLTQFDYVLDCIDTVSAKLLLIRRCKEAGVSILCSMGAANKLDPTAFKVADIEKTTRWPRSSASSAASAAWARSRSFFRRSRPCRRWQMRRARPRLPHGAPCPPAMPLCPPPAGWSADRRSSRTFCARPGSTAAQNNKSKDNPNGAVRMVDSHSHGTF